MVARVGRDYDFDSSTEIGSHSSGRMGEAGVTSLNQDPRRPVITIAKSGRRFKQMIAFDQRRSS